MTPEEIKRHAISLCIKDLPEFVEKVENTNDEEEKSVLAEIARKRLESVKKRIDFYLTEHGNDLFVESLCDIKTCVEESIAKMSVYVKIK
jgi:t-SNARE complex subunit (syntaxin)